jgi:hypothetical protein
MSEFFYPSKAHESKGGTHQAGASDGGLLNVKLGWKRLSLASALAHNSALFESDTESCIEQFTSVTSVIPYPHFG